MGVRHVSGIKEWGGFQRAELIAVLKDQHGMDSGEIADRLALTTQEVNRRYRAVKVLEQMQLSESYGLYARPDMYPIFHEAVSLPVVRTWLGWDEANVRFTNEETIGHFYSLVTPEESDEEEPKEPKITISGIRGESGSATPPPPPPSAPPPPGPPPGSPPAPTPRAAAPPPRGSSPPAAPPRASRSPSPGAPR